MSRGLIVLLLLALGGHSLRADPAENETRIQILEEELERLREESGEPVGFQEYGDLGPILSRPYFIEEGIYWSGYGQFSFTDKRSGRASDLANVDRFGILLGYRFSDLVLLNAEIVYRDAGFNNRTVAECLNESCTVIGPRQVNEARTIVRNVYVDLLFHPSFSLSLGQQPLPLGYSSLRSDPTFYLASAGPQMEGSLMPAGWSEIGAAIHGEFLNGFIHYRAGIYTAPDATRFSAESWMADGAQGGSFAKSSEGAGAARIDVRPLEGLEIGAAGYYAKAANQKVQSVDFFTRLDFSRLSVNDLALATELEESFVASRPADIVVQIAETHARFDRGPVSIRGIYMKGLLNPSGVRAINAHTGRNVAIHVESGYAEGALDLFYFLGMNQKLYLVMGSEYINSQKETFRSHPAGSVALEDTVSSLLGAAFQSSSQLDGGLRALGVVSTSVSYVPGDPDPVNDRRIKRLGLNYFPVPDASIRIVYETWSSASNRLDDIEERNPDNNKIDRVVASVQFRF